jgi:hypothetical protein
MSFSLKLYWAQSSRVIVICLVGAYLVSWAGAHRTEPTLPTALLLVRVLIHGQLISNASALNRVKQNLGRDIFTMMYLNAGCDFIPKAGVTINTPHSRSTSRL